MADPFCLSTPGRRLETHGPTLPGTAQFSGASSEAWGRLQEAGRTSVIRDDVSSDQAQEGVEVFRQDILLGRGGNIRQATALALFEAVQALNHNFHLSSSDGKSESKPQADRLSG